MGTRPRSRTDSGSPETLRRRATERLRGYWRRGRSPDSRHEADRERRAVSSVIAITLLLGVTVILSLTVVPTVLSLGENVDQTPAADFAFKYTEDVNPGTVDSFGTPGTAPGADGLLTITLKEGDEISPEQLTVSGPVSGGLVDDTRAETAIDETMEPGDTLTVWVGRGTTADLIWNAADDAESEILASFDVQPGGATPPGVPTSDTGCGYVESQTPGSIVIKGVTVVCDLDQYDINDITVEDGGGVVGVVEGNGSITVKEDGFTYLGPANSGVDGDDGATTFQSGATINNDVNSNKKVDIDGKSTVNGNIDSDAEVDVSDSTVNGVVDADGTVSINSQSTVRGEVVADPTTSTKVYIKSGSSVGDDVTSGGSGVDVNGGSTVDGTIVTRGQINVQSSSSIAGGLDNSGGSGSDIDVSGSSIGGGVTASGLANVYGDSVVGGPVTSDVKVNVSKTAVSGEIDAGTSAILTDGSADGVEGETKATVTNSSVSGDINTSSAGQTTKIESGSRVSGTVTAGSTVKILSGSSVGGTVEVTSGGTDSKIKGGSTVGGDVVTPGNLDLIDSTVKGNVFVDGTFNCANSTINGQNCSEYNSLDSQFSVTITGTNSSVDEGETLRVDTDIENTESDQGTRYLTLEIDGTETDNKTVTLGGGATTTETLTWATTGGDGGSYTATVTTNRSRDTDDSTPVQVDVPPANLPNIDRFDTDTIKGKPKGVDVDWEVSAGDADLDTVEIEVYDHNGVLTGGSTTDVSGTSASGSEQFEPLAKNKDHDIVLTVTDVNGESRTQTKTQRAG